MKINDMKNKHISILKSVSFPVILTPNLKGTVKNANITSTGAVNSFMTEVPIISKPDH